MNSREEFEKVFPVPDEIYWDEGDECYRQKKHDWDYSEDFYMSAALDGWQAATSRQQERISELERLLHMALSDLEWYELTLEGELGSCRSIQELEAADQLPQSIVEIRAALKALSATAQGESCKS